MNIVVYRNCFTGDVSGGDMHMAGVLWWLKSVKPEEHISLVSAKNDGQAAMYEDVSHVNRVTYWAPSSKMPALLYIMRALLGWWLPRLPYDGKAKNVLIASSHFLPDVLPVAYKWRRKNCERVAYIHHIVQDMPRNASVSTRLAHLQERLCFWIIKKHFQKVIVVNRAVKQRLEELGFTKQSIKVSSNFASSDPLPVRAFAHKTTTILFCGRLVKQKGVYDFMSVCRFLQQKIPDFSAVMIGAGPELERLRELVASENLPVEIKGRISEAEKFKLFNQAKLFVFPSIEEGWGIVVAEALIAGTPALVYDLPVYQEIFDQQLHTVSLGDVDALQQAALELISSYNETPAVYHAEQQHISAFAEQFTKANVAEGEYRFFAL
ncbi:MAG TPA: glycosyltransferase [Candidatus Saccharimonadales bacterium]